MNSQELLAIAVDAIDNKKGEDTIFYILFIGYFFHRSSNRLNLSFIISVRYNKIICHILAIAVDAIDNKKGEDTISLEMKGISDMTDYFVVTHGNNERHIIIISFVFMENMNHNIS
jgi:ribosomal silencing factor RsfS